MKSENLGLRIITFYIRRELRLTKIIQIKRMLIFAVEHQGQEEHHGVVQGLRQD